MPETTPLIKAALNLRVGAGFDVYDAYVNWHCTNEHFTVDEYIIANCEYPGEWDGIIERTEMVNELIITVTQISPHYDSRRRTNYAQKTSLTNSWFVFSCP